MSLHNAFTAASANATTSIVATSAASGAGAAAATGNWTSFLIAIITAGAGAATAVGFPQYKSLEMKGKLVAIGVGMAFALIMGPAFAPAILKIMAGLGANLEYNEGRAIVFYLTGLVGYTAPPMLFKFFSTRLESTLNGLIKGEVVDRAITKNAETAAAAAQNDGSANGQEKA